MEELITYFSLVPKDRIENDETLHLLLRVFVSARTSLPNRDLAKKGGIQLTDPLPSKIWEGLTDTQTDGRNL
jgi:hypothetical protein